MSKDAAKQLLAAAKEMADQRAAAEKEKMVQAGIKPKAHSMKGVCWCGIDHREIRNSEKEAKRNAKLNALAHHDEGICWCGVDHGEVKRRAEEEVLEKQRLQEQARLLALEEEEFLEDEKMRNARYAAQRRHS